MSALNESTPGWNSRSATPASEFPPRALSRIFDRFYKVDETRNQEDGSSGLGLAIAKWIVEAHKATIQVSSEVNVGSTFTVIMAEHVETFSQEGPAHRAVAV
jgi:signal transduction histidine kinase